MLLNKPEFTSLDSNISTAELVGAQINSLKTIEYEKVYGKHKKFTDQYTKRQVGYRNVCSVVLGQPENFQ